MTHPAPASSSWGRRRSYLRRWALSLLAAGVLALGPDRRLGPAHATWWRSRTSPKSPGVDAGGDRLHRARDPRELRPRGAGPPGGDGLLRQSARRCAGARQRRGRDRPEGRSLHPVPSRRRQRRGGREAQGGRDQGPRAERPGRGGADLHRGQRRPPDGSPARRSRSSRSGRGAASRWRRRRRAGLRRGRPRAGAGPGCDAGSRAAAARGAGRHARHEGQPGPGRAAPGQVPRQPSDGQAAAGRDGRHDRAGAEGGGGGGGPRP